MTAFFSAVAVALTAPAPQPSPPPPAGTEAELRFVDDSVMKVALLDEKLELVTKYGTLLVPTGDLKKVDFAHRLTPADVERIATALGDLGSTDFKARERATATLKGLRGKAYPALLKATDAKNPEARDRVEQLIAQIKRSTAAEQLEPRPTDVVQTADSKIAGKLSAAALRVRTVPFGDQAVKLTDLRSVTVGAPADAPAVPAPINLAAYANRFGFEGSFVITFQQGISGGLFGTDLYTLDSSFMWAAVHAGLLQQVPGQTVTVRIRIVPSPAQFIGTQRNGAASAHYGQYPPGAFEFVAK